MLFPKDASHDLLQACVTLPSQCFESTIQLRNVLDYKAEN